MDFQDTIICLAKKAKEAARVVSRCSTDKKNQVLITLADMLDKKRSQVFAQNQKDLAQAKEKGLSSAMIDRLKVTDSTIESMRQGLMEVAQLSDPVGAIETSWLRPNGISVGRMRIPLGVVCMIYESRPNVTVDAAGLCLKAGNAVILRGGSEAFFSNMALGKIISEALEANSLPAEAVQLVPVADRDAVKVLLAQEDYIDLVIPRGGEGLIRFVAQNSRIPVLKHYKGVCHVFVDEDADFNMASEIAFNSKVQRPGVCNAMETMLVHKNAAEAFLSLAGKKLRDAGVEIRGCPKTCKILPWAKPAADDDWGYEFLELILAVKVVDSMDEALDHIAKYGSQHTESIVTQNYARARRFMREADSSMVGVNVSTRFNDGGQLGLGAEIGISTSKLHAFGPMGVMELTATKFVVTGDGQIRK
ncbi:MAG: glutamate-5-semialdehyde dehydrogenase [Desulfatibacillaceae bacterium]|nr:glutamate-5-semialdehyde dehydrogenase [Desulfatibacillaceae bacterium]